MTQLVQTADDTQRHRFHVGSFGIGDQDWPLCQEHVDQIDGTIPNFVKTKAFEWRERSRDIVATDTQLPDTSVKQSCLESYGFCVSEINDMVKYRHVLNQLKQYVSNHRRLHLVGGRNHGPNIDVQHPLLLLKMENSQFLCFVSIRFKISPF